MNRTRHASACRVALAAAALALLLAAAGCSPAREPAPMPAADPAAGGSDTATGAVGAGPVSLDQLQLGLEPVARGFDAPVFVTHAGDGTDRLFVVEQPGRIRVVRDGQIVPGAFLDVSGSISAGGERGLLGLAFSPDYATSGEFYVNYTDQDGNTNVARFVAADPESDSPSLSGPTIVLKVTQPYSNHNGGCIVFEPGSQRLWVGMGDGGSGGDPQGNAQNPRSLLGKMLVLDFSAGASPKPEIVESGVRNPWRFSFDRETNALWIGDVGQNEWEEIDYVELDEARGIDWGWNLWEGTHPFPAGATPSKTGFTFPITEYNHGSGQSVTGGYVYRGSAYPALVGTYLYGDFSAGWIAGLQRTSPDGTPLAKVRVRTLLTDAGIAPSSFGEDAAGELYVCDYGGVLLRVTAQAAK